MILVSFVESIVLFYIFFLTLWFEIHPHAITLFLPRFASSFKNFKLNHMVSVCLLIHTSIWIHKACFHFIGENLNFMFVYHYQSHWLDIHFQLLIWIQKQVIETKMPWSLEKLKKILVQISLWIYNFFLSLIL